jgi:hypothetical protein
MASPSALQTALNAAVMRLLRPLCRLLLRHHVPFSAFEELAKRVYVQVAMEDFSIPGKKPTQSRASILTGLTRKDVQRLLGHPGADAATTEDNYNRAARVLTAWARDADFHGADGQPAPLPVHDGSRSFAELVRRHSGDMPVRAVLDELLRVGAVRQREDERLEPVVRAYVPSGGELEKIGILGTDVADLISTIDHNLQHRGRDAHFQRKVMYRSMPAAARDGFRELSAAQAQRLLETLDAWLAERDTDDPPGQPDAPRVRLGLGIYYFEAPADLEPQQGEKS